MAVVWLMRVPAGRLLDRVYDAPAGYLFASEGGVIHGEQATLIAGELICLRLSNLFFCQGSSFPKKSI